MTTSTPHVLIIGSGIIGLSTALALLDSPTPPQVTLLSSNFPTDSTHPADYASPWAGAHHVSAPNDERERAWDRETLRVLKTIKDTRPTWLDSDALHWARQSELFANPPTTDAERLAQDALGMYRRSDTAGHDKFKIDNHELPHHTAIHFITLDFNVPVYLASLYARFLALGGKTIRARVSSLQEAVSMLHTPPSALFVSPGLGVRSIAELNEQQTTYAVRGQTVLVHAPWLTIPASDDSEHNPTWPGLSRTNEKGERDIYIIPRGRGQFIVGGTRLPHDEDPSPREETTQAILTRALKICPQLASPYTSPLTPRPQDVQVLGVNVGFRPARVGGPVLRLRERERGLPPTILGYGFGGYGYQNSWGVALDARRLLFDALHLPLPSREYTLKSLEDNVPSVEHLWGRRAKL